MDVQFENYFGTQFSESFRPKTGGVDNNESIMSEFERIVGGLNIEIDEISDGNRTPRKNVANLFHRDKKRSKIANKKNEMVDNIMEPTHISGTNQPAEVSSLFESDKKESVIADLFS